jgi:glycosyltransferase involved in cell wall biosynthesis
MADLFEEADAFVYPYRQIDASGAYFMTKAFDKWTVASDVGVFSYEIRDGQNGSLVRPDDADDLARALSKVVADRPKVMQSGQPDNWPEIGVATREIYERAIADRHAAP